MKISLKVLLFLFLILPATQIFAQFDINVTSEGLVNIEYIVLAPQKVRHDY